jgi:hypothetical protein
MTDALAALVDALPGVLILLDVAAAVAYGLEGDARRCTYWIAAGVLTLVVTF